MSAAEFSLGLVHVPQPGQTVSGDHYMAEVVPSGMVAAVFDGLGHGEKAHEAAAKATASLRTNLNEPPEMMIKLCHSAITSTRGGVLSLAKIDVTKQQLQWAGVGNVAAVILPLRGDIQKNRRHLLVHGGIVGYRMPTLRAFTEPFAPGDTLLFATDGIRSGFIDDIPLKLPPQEIADYVFKTYSRGTDDALVLAVRYAI